MTTKTMTRQNWLHVLIGIEVAGGGSTTRVVLQKSNCSTTTTSDNCAQYGGPELS